MSKHNEKFGFIAGTITITITSDALLDILAALTPLLWAVVLIGGILYGYQLFIRHEKVKITGELLKASQVQGLGGKIKREGMGKGLQRLHTPKTKEINGK